MRLIDGDALEKSLEKLWNVHDDQDFANKDVWREIENAPTIEPERKEGESDERYKARCGDMEERDMLICNCIKGALDGIYRNAYYYNTKPRPNEANVALDIWAKLDGRREDGFHMGTEPLVELKVLKEK